MASRSCGAPTEESGTTSAAESVSDSASTARVTDRATAGGWPLSALEIQGLLPDVDLADYLDWLTATAGIWGGPRLAGITVNLMTLDADETAAYLALDLKSRIYPTGLPPQLPAPMVATVEGYTETLTDSEWILSL